MPEYAPHCQVAALRWLYGEDIRLVQLLIRIYYAPYFYGHKNYSLIEQAMQ